MKKIIVFILLLISVISGYAKKYDIRSIGPYNVRIYWDQQAFDPNIELIDSIDLYDYYNLPRPDAIKMKQGVQINVFMSTPSFDIKGSTLAYGLSGSWKQQMSGIFYLNAGLSLGISNGEYGNKENTESYYRKDTMLEIGLPISIEVTNYNHKKASLYAGLGFTPAYYKTIKAEESSMDKENSENKDSGFLVSPRIDFGGYIPLIGKALRVGIYGEYKICCSQNIKIYKKRISKAHIGATVGIVF